MAQPKINLTHLKQYLKNCSQAELIADIAELFKKFLSVKDYYQIKLYPEADKEIIDKYKKIIQNHFFPSRGFGYEEYFLNADLANRFIIGNG